MNPFNYFDKIYYINLDTEPLKNISIKHELKTQGVDMSIVERISGTISKFKEIGKIQSHLNCLLDCKLNRYKQILILEDDFKFANNKQITHQLLNQFFDYDIDWSVLLFHYDNVFEDTSLFLNQVTDADTTSGYAVNSIYLNTMIKFYKNSLLLLSKCTTPEPRFLLCNYWKSFQKSNKKWYTICPALGHTTIKKQDTILLGQQNINNIQEQEQQNVNQYEIEQQIININQNQNRTTTRPIKNKIKYFLAIKCCKPRLNNALQQHKILIKTIHNYPMIFYHFVGDPNQTEDYIVNEKTKIVTLKCKDDYVNVSHKSRMILKFVTENYPNIIGMFQTDDDIKINLPNLYNMLEKYQHHAYYGKRVTIEKPGVLSYHIKHRPENFANYQMIKLYPISLKPATYCAGGGFYLHHNVFSILLNQQQHLFQELSTNLTQYLTRFDDKLCFSDIPLIDDYNIGYLLYCNDIKATDVDISKSVFWPNMNGFGK